MHLVVLAILISRCIGSNFLYIGEKLFDRYSLRDSEESTRFELCAFEIFTLRYSGIYYIANVMYTIGLFIYSTVCGGWLVGW